MKKMTGKRLTYVLAAAAVLSLITISAYAKDDKSLKADKRPSAPVILTKEPVVPAASPIPAAVTLDEAEEIALDHAGVDGADAVFSKEKLDKNVYELKFSDEYGKYEYEISAVDGTILDYKWDVRNSAAPLSDAAGDELVWEGAVSQQQACQTALDDAEVNEEALKYLVCYVSWRDHVPTAYVVKFATRRTAYRYFIDLDTGAILGSVCDSHH